MLVNIVPSLLTGENRPGSLFYRHPEYNKRWWWREFGRVSYLGGRDYLNPDKLSIEFQYPIFATTSSDGQALSADQWTVSSIGKVKRDCLLFQHNREKDWEYENRRARAYYHNVVKTTVNMLVSHAMKRSATRKGDPALEEFWKGVDRKREKSIDSYVKHGSRWAQVKGLMWTCVDQQPANRGGDGKPYAYWVSPLDVLDWETDEYGELVWLKQFVYTEKVRTWESKVEPLYRFRIWDRNEVVTHEASQGGGQGKEIDRYRHGLGRVPWEPMYSLRDEEYPFPDGQALAIDLCKAANHVFNLGSLLSEICYKQTFSWLAIPDKNVSVAQMGLNTAFGYDGSQSTAVPTYISPDPEQARVLMEAIGDTLEQARQSIGTGRGRSEGSKEQPSADALELESEDKNSILADVAEEAEDFERRLVKLFDAYRNKAPSEDVHIQYPRQFDVRSFQAEVNECLSMQKVQLSPEVNLEMAQRLVSRMFAGMEPAKLQALVDSLKPAHEEAQKQAEEQRQAMLGMSPEKDDDGEDGGKPTGKKPAFPPKKPQPGA